MANEKFPFGRNAAMYWNNASKLLGDTGVETAALWLADAGTVVQGAVRNLNLALDDVTADGNTRDAVAGGFASEIPVLKGANVTFDCPWDLSDAFLTTIITAWSSNPPSRVGLAILNRDKDSLVTGDILNGMVGNFYVSLNKDENVDDVQRGNFTIRHADSGVWYTLTAV